jgi:hypothetical protein
MEGMHRYDEWQRIRLRVEDNQCVPQIVKPLNLDELTEQEKIIVPYIDGERTIEAVALQTHNAEFIVARFVFSGLVDGTMALVVSQPKAKVVAVGRAPEAIENDVEMFLERGRAQLKEDPQKAYRMFKVASDLDPADGRAVEEMREAEREIRASLDRNGVTGDKIPELAIPIGQLTELTLSPHAGFVLSRINGEWDVKSITKISPIKELEVLMIFDRFVQDGVIRLKKKKKKK